MSTFCRFFIWDEENFFLIVKQGSIPHKPVLIGPNLLRALLAIASRVGETAKVA
jgi:hypothetical protein